MSVKLTLSASRNFLLTFDERFLDAFRFDFYLWLSCLKKYVVLNVSRRWSRMNFFYEDRFVLIYFYLS